MQAFTLICSAAILASFGFGQTPAQAKGKAASASKPTIQITCTDKASEVACKTFKAMLDAKDPDIVSDIKSENFTYICPRTGADDFFVVTLERPKDSLWWPSDISRMDGLQEQEATSKFVIYANGVFENGMFAWGKWTKGSPKMKNETSFYIAKPSRTYTLDVRANESEISLESEYPNASGTQTVNTQTIRRSTGRFRETWKIKDAKENLQVGQGQCFMFGQGAQ